MIRLRFFKKTDDNKINKAMIMLEADMDRVKNIEKSPPDIRRDCRKEFSSIGPRINAMTKGAGSYPHFLKR